MKRTWFIIGFMALTVALGQHAWSMSISDAKLLPVGQPVSLTQKVVTYSATDFFYIEEDARNIGIRVEKAGHGLAVGMRADVNGTVETSGDVERYIQATSAVQTPEPNAYGVVDPVFLSLKVVGGADWHYAAGGGQMGISGAVGLNNIGLLVRVQGRVQQGAPGDTEPMSLDDGSGLPVRVILPTGVTSPGYGAVVVVTGVVSCMKDHRQITGPEDPTYQDFQMRSILATSVQTVVPAPAWNYPGPMIYIPAGSYLMGNSGVGDDLYYDQQYDLSYEKPQHSVNLSGYWIGKYEVTRGEYRAFMNAGGYSTQSYWSSAGWAWKGTKTEPTNWWVDPVTWGTPPGEFSQGDSRPVVGVTYYEAEAFCNWAGGHLPTEAQWEKTARWTGSHPNVYPWGDTWDQQKCNNWYDSLYQGYQTSPVGSYLSGASPYGCQDMAGNVWEWCQDWYKSYPGSGSPFDYTGNSRVLRGGGWDSGDGGLTQCAFRGDFNPDCGSLNDVGFRLAR